MEPLKLEFDGELKSLYLDYSAKTKESIMTFIGLELTDLFRNINIAKSPIEQMFIPLLKYQSRKMDRVFNKVDSESNIETTIQKEIKVYDQTFYTDFFVDCYVFGEHHYFAIECDGHDFHEKTKEQARRDKSRERKLTSENITVIRFTGSEIYEDAYDCAIESFFIITKTTGVHGKLKELENNN